MDDELFTVHGGILGTRKLSGAYADLLLRKLGVIKEGQSIVNRYIAWGQLGHRPWRADEIARGRKLLADGVGCAAVAKILRRSKHAVRKKLAA